MNAVDTSSASASDPDMLLTIEIPSRFDFVALVRMIVAAAANSVNVLSGNRLDDLRLVVSEATTNAIEANMETMFAGAVDPEVEIDTTVKITCDVSNGRVTIAVSDAGGGLNRPPPLPDMTDPDRLFIEGGFGVPLIENLSNAVAFNSCETGTTVTIEMLQHQ